MVKHIIIWELNENLSDEEKKAVRSNAKINLEGLKGRIDGLITIEVTTELLNTSNGDMMLYTEFSDSDALKNYASNPYHNAVADKYVRPFIQERFCVDFEC